MDKIKIIGGLSEFKPEKNSKSLLTRITEAKSEMEVNSLLELGKTYKKVSVKTMKMWERAANKKINSF